MKAAWVGGCAFAWLGVALIPGCSSDESPARGGSTGGGGAAETGGDSSSSGGSSGSSSTGGTSGSTSSGGAGGSSLPDGSAGSAGADSGPAPKTARVIISEDVMVEGTGYERSWPFRIQNRLVVFMNGSPANTITTKTVDASLTVTDQLDAYDVGSIGGDLMVAPDESVLVFAARDPAATGFFGTKLWVTNGTKNYTSAVQDGIADGVVRVVMADGLGFANIQHVADATASTRTYRTLRIHFDAPSAELLPVPSEIKEMRLGTAGAGLVFGSCEMSDGVSYNLCALADQGSKYQFIRDTTPDYLSMGKDSFFSTTGLFAFLGGNLNLWSTDGSNVTTATNEIVPPCPNMRMEHHAGFPYLIGSCGQAGNSLYGMGSQTSATELLLQASKGLLTAPTASDDDGNAYFVAYSDANEGLTVYKTNHTGAGTKPLFTSSRILARDAPLARVGNWIYFGATDQRENRGRSALFRASLDGQKLEEIVLGVRPTTPPHHLYALGNHLVFGMFASGQNEQIWAVENAGD